MVEAWQGRTKLSIKVEAHGERERKLKREG